MELYNLDTKSVQEEGAFCHLTHPKFGHKMYTGDCADEEGRLLPEYDEDEDAESLEPVGVTCRGMEAPSVLAQAKKIDRLMKPGKNRMAIDAHEAGIRFAQALVSRFHGVEEDGEELKATKDNIARFFGMSDDLVEQVVVFAKERNNFFGNASND